MRRLPLYCEAGPATTYDRRRRDNFATREVVSSLFVFCVCVCYSVCLLQLACVYLCVERAASCTLFGALLLCVSGVFGCERECERGGALLVRGGSAA